ncbi:MAG: glycoside hydrolase family 2 protein [Beijerinckiaceae bacterium]|nr:glycoside hydrolase family 2 protein [Beijerinckiaceae bacterium]
MTERSAAMLGIPGIAGRTEPLGGDWRLCLTTPQQFASPPHGVDLDWIEAQVPGTAAAALERAGRFQRANPPALDEFDIWYSHPFNADEPVTLTFGGLATIAEVWLDDEMLLRSQSMFLSHSVNVDPTPAATLWLCFRSLASVLARPAKRARWRPRMVTPSALNGVRTTLLGRVPGWCPSIPPVGPWRPITVDRNVAPQHFEIVHFAALYQNGKSMLHCSIKADEIRFHSIELVCAGYRISMHEPSTHAGKRLFSATLEMADVAPWWPHTHGTPTLHEAALQIDGRVYSLGRVGFRTIAVDRGPDGADFRLVCNGVPIFCRGACWTPADLIAMTSDRESYERRLDLAKRAGMNMLRVGGTMVYEEKGFYDLCDELGILVWQDFMFANFDYPATNEGFVDLVRQEAAQFLALTRTNPCLAILCGGSEVYQQAAMLGLPEKAWQNPIFTELLPALCAERRPDTPYVENSPSGGALPFFSDRGVAHYYGVGAYLRPLDDARRANVRFAAECLAFANVPEKTEHWMHGVPRDIGADWDFADVRNHYLAVVFGCDPRGLLASDEDRYLELSRASTAHVFSRTFAEWRRAGTSNGGALIWFLADIERGSGWGVIDVDDEPKSVWHAMRQTLQPVQMLATDEGVNGLALHVINETAEMRRVDLELRCYQNGSQRVVDGRRTIELAAHSQIAIAATDLLGAFFDLTYAFRFGPPSHDVVTLDLFDHASGETLSRFDYFPLGLGVERHDLGLKATLRQDGGSWFVEISAARFAQFVQIMDEHFRPQENWFHLPPGASRRIVLEPRSDGPETPVGRVRAVNGLHACSYGEP